MRLSDQALRYFVLIFLSHPQHAYTETLTQIYSDTTSSSLYHSFFLQISGYVHSRYVRNNKEKKKKKLTRSQSILLDSSGTDWRVAYKENE